MPKTIIWLASYPKSGNTWLRMFLFNYLFNPDKPAPINQAHRIGPSDATAALYTKAVPFGLNITDPRAVLTARPSVVSAHAGNGADVNFMKTHNANIPVDDKPLIMPEHTRGAIYVLRDPLDMAVSYAAHYGLSHDNTAEAIGSASNTILPDQTKSVVHQYLGNWSDHVLSWAKPKGFKSHVIRYEDMQSDPEGTFAGVLKYIGAPSEPERLARAVRFSSFDEVKKQEDEHGFVEKSLNAERFFRAGRVGDGRKQLPQSAIDRICADHGDVMKQYGYL